MTIIQTTRPDLVIWFFWDQAIMIEEDAEFWPVEVIA